jgi:hypothetical protein
VAVDRNGRIVKQQDDRTGKERTAEQQKGRDETVGAGEEGSERAETDTHARTHARHTPYQRQGIGVLVLTPLND